MRALENIVACVTRWTLLTTLAVVIYGHCVLWDARSFSGRLAGFNLLLLGGK